MTTRLRECADKNAEKRSTVRSHSSFVFVVVVSAHPVSILPKFEDYLSCDVHGSFRFHYVYHLDYFLQLGFIQRRHHVNGPNRFHARDGE